jgi:hypothetical protein
MAFPSQLRRAELYCDLRALAPPTAFADDGDPINARVRDAARTSPTSRHAKTMRSMKALCQVGNGENYPSLPPKKLQRKDRSSAVYGSA